MSKQLKKLNNCLECQFENGKHSQDCSRFAEPIMPELDKQNKKEKLKPKEHRWCSACQEMFDKNGEKTTCCECSGHQCQSPKKENKCCEKCIKHPKSDLVCKKFCPCHHKKIMTPKTIKEWEKEFIEKGANLEHDRWSRWHRYSRLMATPQNIEMWDDKAEKPYIALTGSEKESDRQETRNYLPLIQQLLLSERQRLREEIEKMEQPITFFDDQNRGHDYGRGFMVGFEKALSDILKLLEDK